MRQTWMAQLILAISLCGMSLFILKVFYYSYAWFCSLSEGRTSFFCTRLFNRKLSVNSYFCFQLALLHSVSYFFSLYQSPSLPSCKVSDAISSNIDEVLLINLFPNVFIFVIHHKDWLTWWNWQTWWTLLKFFYLKWPYSDGWLSYSDPWLSHSCSYAMDFFFLLTLLFVLYNGFLSIQKFWLLLSQFPLTFHQAQNYSCADWDGLCAYFRNAPWDDIFKLDVPEAGWLEP